MEVTFLTWVVAIGGLLIIGILMAAQLVAVIRPRDRWTVENVYGGDPQSTDPTAYFAFNRGMAWADVFFNGMFPFMDAYSGGSLAGFIAACQQALAVVDDDSKIIPGHGPLGNRNDLIAYRNMLQTAEDAVAPLVRQGKSLEEIHELDPLAPLVGKWGGGFIKKDQFIALILEGMKN